MTGNKLLRRMTSAAGLTLICAGAALLALHFFLHLSSNIPLLAAIGLEIAGAAIHYYKVVH